MCRPPEAANTECKASQMLMARGTSTQCHVFFSCPFTPQSLVLPCLGLAGCLAEDSEPPGSRTEICWKQVHGDGQQQIQLHLSLAVKPAVWTRGQEGTGGEEWGACACMWMCVCLGVGGYSGGALIGMSELHGVCVREGEREGGGMGEWWSRGVSVSSSWASEQVLLYVSQAHESPTGETQYKFGFISTPCIDLFWLLLWGFWFKGNNRWFSGENVSALFLNQLSPLWKFFLFSMLELHLDDSVCFSFSFSPFVQQVAECRRLEQCQIHLRMWKPSPGPPHPPCLLHPRLSAKQPIAMLHSPLLQVNQVRNCANFDFTLRLMSS